MEYISNRELAKDYCSVVAQEDVNLKKLDERTSAILQCSENLHQYYTEKGCLKGLRIEGVDRGTIALLERILRAGFKRVKQEILDNIRSRDSAKNWCGDRRDSLGEAGNSWDNIVARLENSS